MLVLDRAQEVANWVASRYFADAPSVDAAIGFERDGKLVAGVFFDGASSNNVFAHIAAAGSIPRALLRAVARTVYETWGMERMTFFFSMANHRVHRLVSRMGARVEAIVSRAFSDGDGVMYVLWRDDPFVRALLR